MDCPAFHELPDLAVRSLGGSVVYANDEAFAQRENLITPGPARHDRELFGPKGKVYDGWETRRRREPGHDEVIVALGAPGIVAGVVVDTAWFTGNYPPEASVEGIDVDGHPSVEELLAADGWRPLLARSALKGDAANEFAVSATRRCTHVRLRIYPDGGVARLRVHGSALPDPRQLDALGVFDLAALEHGGVVLDCSNRFYSAPNNLLLPGPTRSMAEGWETARRRDDGNDWVQVKLAGEGRIRIAELDTSYNLHNAPGWASLRGRSGGGEWFELLGRTPLRPDTRHRFLLPGGDSTAPADEVRLDVYPDGGMARLRLFGALTEAGRAELGRRWTEARPSS
ncbi:MAG TPA: allantoicase [Pseudonocardia sp.]|nr:allantoicase [Pseudonocardia sp.]